MGKKARGVRSAVKEWTRKLGYREDEFGELKVPVTKAEARRRFLDWKWQLSFLVVETISDMRILYEVHKGAIQNDLLAGLGSRIMEEIDAQVLGLVV